MHCVRMYCTYCVLRTANWHAHYMRMHMHMHMRVARCMHLYVHGMCI